MKKIIFLFLISTFSLNWAQTIKGSIPEYKEKQIKLTGNDGFTEKILAETKIDQAGNFAITYDKNYRGSAILQILEGNSLILLLNDENFEIIWNDPKTFESLKFSGSKENTDFFAGIKIFQSSDGKVNGLRYLLPLYEADPEKKKWLTNELDFQNQIFENFLKKLPKKSYSLFYLKSRKMISTMENFTSQKNKTYPEIQKEFESINFNDPDLWQSGLYKLLLDQYFLLTENWGDSKTISVNTQNAVDQILSSVKSDPTKQLDIATYLIKLLEKKSLLEPAEHLALRMLQENTSVKNDKRLSVFEQYRKIAVGNIAPEIQLDNNKLLSEVKNPYKLVVFGASWCPYCMEELPKLKASYPELKANYDLEAIYISIDHNQVDYDQFMKDTEFIKVFGKDGWESKPAKDYYVFSTPTMLLLDKDNKILAKIRSIPHLDAWMKEFAKRRLE